MRLLLDTHILLWWDMSDAKLSPEIRAVIARADSQVFVSVASIWEIAIKRELGKLRYDGDLSTLVMANRFAALPIDLIHAEEAGRMPRHHGDPFDRMLVAQAKIEGLVLATQDKTLSRYGIATIGA